MLVMWDVGFMGYWGCWMLMVCDGGDMGYPGCEMMGMCDVRGGAVGDVGCSRCGMFWKWDVDLQNA